MTDLHIPSAGLPPMTLQQAADWAQRVSIIQGNILEVMGRGDQYATLDWAAHSAKAAILLWQHALQLEEIRDELLLLIQAGQQLLADLNASPEILAALEHPVKLCGDHLGYEFEHGGVLHCNLLDDPRDDLALVAALQQIGGAVIDAKAHSASNQRAEGSPESPGRDPERSGNVDGE